MAEESETDVDMLGIRMDRVEAELVVMTHRVQATEGLAAEVAEVKASMRSLEAWQVRQNGSLQRLEQGVDRLNCTLTSASGKLLLLLAGIVVSILGIIVTAVVTRL